MSALLEIIRAEIAKSGPMDIARYMDLCLSHPEYGYYMTRDPLGAEGDFITAPEISQLFGEMVGLWLAQVWIDQGRPQNVKLVELGPGRGTLMKDVLRVARSVPGFRDALDVWLIETSATLKDIQKETLGAQVSWAGTLSAVPEGATLLVANEFFDALPVQQYQKVDTSWLRRTVTASSDGRLTYKLVKSERAPSDHASALLPDGAIIETANMGCEIAKLISERVSENGVGALIIDYGAIGGSGDTLQALRAHEPEPALENPGEADLTTHVNFGQLRAALSPDCAVQFTAQGSFLTELGIGQRAAALASGKSDEVAREIAAALRRLTDDAQMGKLFKVMALLPKSAPRAPGFMQDVETN